MSYKSKHTGKQVDEAVSKVLNGEVGGGVTPDWNAQEGEAGYIENRTHYEETIFSKFIEPNSDLSEYNIEIKDENIRRLGVINCIEILDGNDSLEVFPVYFDFDKTNTISKYIEREEVTVTVSSTDWSDVKSIKIEFSNRPLDFDVTTIGILGLKVSHISEKFIPDTFLKTTPQKLSDTDKNQALTNLGIDPVVWKYMCNPFIIYMEQDNPVPDDLLSIIDKGGSLNLNPIILKLMVVKYEHEDSTLYNIHTVESNAVYYDTNSKIDYSNGVFIWV